MSKLYLNNLDTDNYREKNSYLSFYLNTAKGYYDFSFVRLIVNEKEVSVNELKDSKLFFKRMSKCEFVYNISNKILKVKNLELIYSVESSTRQFYFFHDLNNSSLIINENFLPHINPYSYFLKYMYFSLILKHSEQEKFYTVIQ